MTTYLQSKDQRADIELSSPVQEKADNIEKDTEDIVVKGDGISQEIKNRDEDRVGDQSKQVNIIPIYIIPVLSGRDLSWYFI